MSNLLKSQTLYVTLRAARQNDIGRVVSFLTQANDPNVLPRPDTDYGLAVQRKMLFLITCQDQLRGVAGVFPLFGQPHTLHECGSFYIDSSLRGFRLADVLYSACVGGVFIFFGGGTQTPMAVVTATKPDHVPMESSIARSGFVPVKTVNPLLLVPCSQCSGKSRLAPGGICCCNFYELAQNAVSAHLRLLTGNNPWLRTSSSSAKTLEITSLIFRSQTAQRILQGGVHP